MNCPSCNIENDDNWTLEIGVGGCQDCWEKECDEKWWEMYEN